MIQLKFDLIFLIQQLIVFHQPIVIQHRHQRLIDDILMTHLIKFDGVLKVPRKIFWFNKKIKNLKHTCKKLNRLIKSSVRRSIASES